LNKIILKVTLKTIAVILSILIIFLAVLTMFAPMTLANFNKKLGNNSLAASFTIIEYNRNKDINDLADIVELSILSESYSRILKYSDFLINHSKFNEFCAYKDKNTNINIYATYKQFIYGWNVTALYEKNEKELAFERAKGIVPSNYSRNNALQYLILVVAEENDKTMAEDIMIYLQEKISDILSEGNDLEEQKLIAARLETDIDILESIIEK
jgi:hypothetical protein